MNRLLIAALLGLSLTGAECQPAPRPAPTPATIDGGAIDCETACSVLTAHGCIEARPTDRGILCIQICRDTPLYVGLPIGCIARAGSAAELRACGVCQ